MSDSESDSEFLARYRITKGERLAGDMWNILRHWGPRDRQQFVDAMGRLLFSEADQAYQQAKAEAARAYLEVQASIDQWRDYQAERLRGDE